MRETIPTELLLRLMNATPEQYVEVENILLGKNSENGKQRAEIEHGGRSRMEDGRAVPEDVARQLFALIRELDIKGRWRKAPILQVFRLYCMEILSRDEVARHLGCARSLISLRLKQIEKKLGRKPTELRQLSSHFERIEDSLSDSRARKIRRSGLVDERGDQDD